ncbi:hypothetical protein C8Q76DRAFT_739216 [Earliella scabrosa]|nr:hypothetical protein C8Q76DRAFT_739216 [Earliella scabrosa]
MSSSSRHVQSRTTASLTDENIMNVISTVPKQSTRTGDLPTTTHLPKSAPRFHRHVLAVEREPCRPPHRSIAPVVIPSIRAATGPPLPPSLVRARCQAYAYESTHPVGSAIHAVMRYSVSWQ